MSRGSHDWIRLGVKEVVVPLGFEPKLTVSKTAV
ncbi:uncharacterized protein METZ01_LOCUS374089, partial [marine metagenome]